MKVFISKLGPLKLQASVDHPHGSGEDHIHGPFGENTQLATPFDGVHAESHPTNLIESQLIDLCQAWTHVDQISSAS